ncbi:rhodanese-like domain-containing protein chloroplastic-like [Trifolium pratense]|uniref:Rhodanese-like domain-containing protein chloroplastic-like n=1 Tax=Trifolium pratense TaxID=57577 RepID=A0A2K3PK89_TRIPR|nr:rhodanese-like domain-containing protein chloroplastic-like [Trifolium pratense]
MQGKLASQCQMRRNFTIKAEVKFVTADDAKELVAVDGYNVLDVRDISQFERAHIKTCYHVPLFVENTDNDPGAGVRTPDTPSH